MIWGAGAAWAVEGTVADLGGERCALGPERVLATTSAPRGPSSVRAALGPDGGLALWQPERGPGLEGQAFDVRLEKRGEGVRLPVEVSHLAALQPAGDGFLFVGWGSSDRCPSHAGCVVAAQLDAAGALVGQPAVWPAEGTSGPVRAGVEAAADGRVWRVLEQGTWDAQKYVVLEVASGPSGPTFRTWPLAGPVTRPTSDLPRIVLEPAGAGWIAAVQDAGWVEVHRDGARFARFEATEHLLSLDPRGPTVWLASSVHGAEGRDVAADGTVGGPRVPSAADGRIAARLDVGVHEDRGGARIDGLILHRRDRWSRGFQGASLVAPQLQRTLARDVQVVGDRLLLSYVTGDARGIWRAVVRDARCPAP